MLRPRGRYTPPLLALGAVLALAGCGGASEAVQGVLGTGDEKPCPRVVIVSDARYMVDVTPGVATREGIRVAGWFTIPFSDCDYEDGTILVDLQLPIEVARGPQLAKGRLEFDFPYFVAVADRANNILGKEVFVTKLKMGGDQERTATVEKIEHIIPVRPEQDGSHFVIYVGFQLTPEQVEFNRNLRF